MGKDKRKTAVIGATGVIGQQLVKQLYNHPMFRITHLAASPASAGKPYGEALVDRTYIGRVPEIVAGMEVITPDDINPDEVDAVFSALDAKLGETTEPHFAVHVPVISTSAAFRYKDDVPILIPEVNPAHVRLLDIQKERRGWKGYIVPISNCTTAGLAMSLKPLLDTYGIEQVYMVSMQALSGAGLPGIREGDPYRTAVFDNVIPHIPKEEGKVRDEARKMLGSLVGEGIVDAPFNIYCKCNRVSVQDGHTESVFVRTTEDFNLDDVVAVMSEFSGEPQRLNLPSAPQYPIIVFSYPTPGDLRTYRPQPRMDADSYGGMTTLVGVLVREDANILSYTLLSHNTKRGGAKGAVLNAEYLAAKGYM